MEIAPAVKKAFFAAEQLRASGEGEHFDSSKQQRASSKVPSHEPEKKLPFLVSFNQEELHLLQLEVHRLQQYSFICKIFGSRPNRQELKELLYGRLQLDADTIKDIRLMGKGYHHIEFAKEESTSLLLANNPLDLRGAQALFSSWQQGFNESEADK